MKALWILLFSLVVARPTSAGEPKKETDPAKLLDAIKAGDWDALEEFLKGRDEQDPTWKRLRLVPAAAPAPALRHRLMPELRETKAGNAVMLYRRASSLFDLERWLKEKDAENLNEWLQMPLDELPPARELPPLPREALTDVDRGARREHCAWELLGELQGKGIGALVPEVSSLRELARLLCLRARLEMKAGRFDDALATLQTHRIDGDR